MGQPRWIGAAAAVLAEITLVGGAIAAGAEDQAKFCRIIDDASAAYGALYARWSDEENGLKQDRMAAELDRMENDRNAAVYQLLGAGSPRIEGWSVTITEISSTFGKGRITLSGSFGCRVPVDFTSGWEASPAIVELLANKSIGDPLKVTATLDLGCGLTCNLRQLEKMKSPDFILRLEKLDDVPEPVWRPWP
jgi:hypothetical protein